MQQITQQACPNCRRSIDTTRLPLHMHMCSTMMLRKSKIFTKQQEPQDQHLNLDCIFCGLKFSMSHLESHMANCQHRQVQCKACGKMYPWSMLAAHQEFCLNSQLKSAKIDFKMSELKGKQQKITKTEIAIKNEVTDKEQYMSYENIKYGLNTIGSKLISQGGKLAERFNTFFQQNKDPALESLKKLRESLWFKMQDLFAFIVADPNTDGLPPTKIRQIEKGQYRAKNSEEQEQICAVCICDFQDEEPIKILSCNHIFHPQCIDKWMKINKKCPLCNCDQLKGTK